MSIRADDKLRREQDLPFRVLAGETVLVDPRRREVHVFNDTGTRIWELLAEKRTFGELVTTLAKEYETEAQTVEGEVRGFVENLTDKGLLLRDEAA